MTRMKKVIFLIKECFKGKTISRSLHNWHLKEKCFNGYGLDYGAKKGINSYYRFLKIDEEKMTYTDFYYGDGKKILKIDFEKPFDLSNNQFDFAFLFNVLEHVYNHQGFVNCIFQSLKKGGVIEGVVPFIHQYHADPDDFFRYTHNGLKNILSKAGFDNIKITRIGVGMFTCATALCSRALKFKSLISLCWIIAIALDWLLMKFYKNNKNFYTALAFSARK